MKTVLQKTREDLLAGKITLRKAAEIVHRHGFTSFIDEDRTKRLLGIE